MDNATVIERVRGAQPGAFVNSSEFRGVLTGQPDYTGPHAELSTTPA